MIPDAVLAMAVVSYFVLFYLMCPSFAKLVCAILDDVPRVVAKGLRGI
jgi:hypothetical protein